MKFVILMKEVQTLTCPMPTSANLPNNSLPCVHESIQSRYEFIKRKAKTECLFFRPSNAY